MFSRIIKKVQNAQHQNKKTKIAQQIKDLVIILTKSKLYVVMDNFTLEDEKSFFAV